MSKSNEIVEAIVVRGVDKHFQGALSKPEISQAAAKVCVTPSPVYLALTIYQDGVCIVRILSDGIAVSASQDDSKAFLSSPNSVSNALGLRPGDTAFLAKRSRIAEVSRFPPEMLAVISSDDDTGICRVGLQGSVVSVFFSPVTHKPLANSSCRPIHIFFGSPSSLFSRVRTRTRNS